MARSKRNRRSQSQALRQPEQKKTRWQKIRKLLPFGIVLGLLGLLPTLASYTTRLSVDIGPQIDPTKPFSFPATISNEGTFPVQIEEYILGWHELKTSKGDQLKDTVLSVSPVPAAEVYPGAKYDLVIPLDKMAEASPAARLISPGATITDCDLLIGVKCKTVWFITQYQIFHFRAVVKPDGQNYWSPGSSFSSRWVYKTLRNASGHH